MSEIDSYPYLQTKYGNSRKQGIDSSPMIDDPYPYQYQMQKQGMLNEDYGNLKNQASMSQVAANQAGSPTDTQPLVSPAAAQGFARGQSGGLGSGIISAGVASNSPYAMGAGLGIMALEGDAQGKQLQEQAQAKEAQQRKQDQLASINQLISVSKGLTVGA